MSPRRAARRRPSARGTQRGAQAIQIFNQNPRAWKPRAYSDAEVAAFPSAAASSEVGALLIHAVYLLNCASTDPEIRSKSLTSLELAAGRRRARRARGRAASRLRADG